MQGKSSVSLILPTRNRLPVLEETVDRLIGLPYPEKEILIVDSASTDGTAEAMARRSGVRFFRLGRNNPAAARNLGARSATGEFIVMLDDDSFPLPGAIPAMLRAFRADPRLAAAGFRIQSPEQIEEPVPRHDVFIGCGVGYRRSAFLECGGYPEDFGYYAEEYAVALELLDRGYHVRCLDDAVVVHLKTERNRSKQRIFYRLVRNNALLNARHFPLSAAVALTAENLERYCLIARKERALLGFGLGVGVVPWAFWRGLRTRRPFSERTLERFRMQEMLTGQLEELFPQGTRIAYWELGRHVRSFITAARTRDLQVEAVYDHRFHRFRRRIARVPVLPGIQVRGSRADAVVLTATSPGGIATARYQLREIGVDLPVVSLAPGDAAPTAG